MARQHNWADNHTFAAARISRPGSIDEARRIVAAASRIRALGTRHCFNDIADSPGEIIDLGGLAPDLAVDEQAREASFAANLRYGDLAIRLQERGWAIHNMASLPHISVAGAVATGTHGSGDRNGTLSTAVAGLELINAEGDLVTVRRGDHGFNGMVVGLGAFGVVTRITLDIEPSFSLRQDALTALPWERLTGDLDAVMGAGYSVSLFTMWSSASIDQIWIKTRLDADGPGEPNLGHLGASTGEADVASMILSAERLTTFGGVPGPWLERLPHMRFDHELADNREIQSEYMLPRASVAQAVRLLRSMADRIDPHLRSTEIRSMAADQLWLSPAFGDARIAIHFNWKQHPAEVSQLSHEIEQLLLPLGGRPHWGKVLHAGAGQLAPLYRRISDFRALARAMDSKGKFRNAYLDRHVLGA